MGYVSAMRASRGRHPFLVAGTTLGVLLLAAQLSGQVKPVQRADTVQVRAAAAAFSLPAKVRSGGPIRLIADTAWHSFTTAIAFRSCMASRLSRTPLGSVRCASSAARADGSPCVSTRRWCRDYPRE